MPITATPLQIAPAWWSCANCGSQRYSRVTTTSPKPDSGRFFRLLERIALCQCYTPEWDSSTRELKDSRVRAARSFSWAGKMRSNGISTLKVRLFSSALKTYPHGGRRTQRRFEQKAAKEANLDCISPLGDFHDLPD